MAEQRVPVPSTELRLLRCGLRGLADVPQLRAPEGQRLRLLHLHGNALATLRGLDAVCPLLEELTLSSNDLQNLEGIQKLQKLRFLDLSCNCLSSLRGLEALSQLQELRAAYNQISQLFELSFFAKPSQLRLLDLRDNSITHLGQLLFLGGFPLEDLRFQSAGGRRSNPMCRLPGYRTTVLRTAPELQSLDEEMLGSRERDELPPAPVVLPEGWPPRPQQHADTSQAALLEAKQQLLVLQEERQGHLQALAESRAAGVSAQESLASAVPKSKAVPKISQQVQQELKLVAAEAKRRQAMNRELKVKLSQTLQQLQQTKESERSLRVKTQQLRGRNQLAFLEQQEASVEIQSFEADFDLAQSQREEAAARLSQEILEADLLLAETEEETQALASAKMELHQRQHRQLILKDQLQRLREDSKSRSEEMLLAEGKLQRGHSRCLAEAAAGEAAMQGSEEAEQLLAQKLKVKALAAEDVCRELWEAEEEIRLLTRKGEEQRAMLQQEVRDADAQLEEIQAQRQAQRHRKDLERQDIERRFKEHHASLVLEAKSLQEDMERLRVKSLEEDRALRCFAEATEESRQEELLLESALRQANSEEKEVQGQFLAEDVAFHHAEDALKLAEAEFSQEEQRLRELQASLRKDFVPAQLLEEEEQFAHALKQEEASALKDMKILLQEEEEAAESLMSSSPARVRDELSQMQVRVGSVTSDFKQADSEMDAMQHEVQSLQGEVAAQQDAHAKRDADWQRAGLEVQRRVQNALAQEEAAADAAQALQEELDGLKQEFEHYDEDMQWLEESVEQATESWSSMPFAHAEHLEVENLRQARQAEEQLSSLSLALSKELQKHREANQSLAHVVESEQEELQGYAREEKLMQDAWNKERQALAEEAATVATELQRLATGL